MAAFTMREDCWYFKEAVWDFSVIYFGEGMLLLTAQLEADMDFYGSTASGKRVNARSAMQMTAVYSCVRILSEAVAGLPLQFYRYNDNGGKEKAVDHPLYFLLHDEPNPEMTSLCSGRL